MTEQEKECAEAIAKAVGDLPLPAKKLVQVYAEGLADARGLIESERNSGEQSGSDPTEQPDP